MSNQNVVYTCITNSYDTPAVHTYINPDWDYILYTDNDELIKQGQFAHWQVRSIVFSNLDHTRNARYHKVNAHLLFPEYKYSLYVDGNVNIVKPLVFECVSAFIAEGKPFVAPLHLERNCIYEEGIVIKHFEIDDPELVHNYLSALLVENYPQKIGLFDTSTMLREHNDPTVQKMQELWWQTICNFSKRDQLSHMYAAWKNNLEITPFFTARKRYRLGKEFQLTFNSKHVKDIEAKASKNKPPVLSKENLQVFVLYKNRFADFGYTLNYTNNEYVIASKSLIISGPALNTLWTCFDVLCKGDYNITQNNNYVLFDIGFNIGSVTVLKAQDEKCKQIYAFEPFKLTYNLGRSNVHRNKNSEKVEVFNFGLSNEDKSLVFNYNPELPGGMSTSREVFNTGIATQIELKKSSTILAPLFEKHSESIMLKIDCEGSEFEIIEDLDKHNLLSKVDVIVMEWHFQDPQIIIDTLAKNNFIVFNDVIRKNDLGFIKAVRKQ